MHRRISSTQSTDFTNNFSYDGADNSTTWRNTTLSAFNNDNQDPTNTFGKAGLGLAGQR